MNCRYYTEQTLGWMLNNKLIVFLSLLCFCLFVSTLALSGQKGRLQDEVAELKAATTTVAPTEAPNNTTEAPGETPETGTETPEEPKEPETTTDNGTGENPGENTDNGTGENPGENTDNGSDGSNTVPAKSEQVEATNEENVSENVNDIVKGSKLLSLIAA
ncbi:uncharacterized protein LOC125233966 [Leguminivora glycinivorella]|uniref:uncharacterized protein LOC125233966 n=1 Tax=Leguminivora glycinivorella TaxID=1035111 RepID=UPI00200D7D1D|nr:uncharacterized protein LOC125233966 [Leguminivora glycinivorella]